MKLTYAPLRKQRTHNLRYIVRTLLMKLAPGVPSLIAARSNTFMEIDHEIISTVIFLPSAESLKKVVVIY